MKTSNKKLIALLLFAAACQSKEEKKEPAVVVPVIESAPLTGDSKFNTFVKSDTCSSLSMIVNCNPPDHYEVERFTSIVFKKILGKPNPFRNEELDQRYLSAELYRLILEAKATEKLSRESILKSSAPTDKPLLIEGEQFCGLDEGFTGYSLENNYSFIEHAFTAYINFENTHYKEKWRDTFHFIKETDGWKLHDIVYGTKKSPKSLKQVLTEFILAGKAEQKQLQKQLKK
ncbi:MAG: hypothetical protein ACK52X_00485 [bacterium]